MTDAQKGEDKRELVVGFWCSGGFQMQIS